jgi:hypothetical protein
MTRAEPAPLDSRCECTICPCASDDYNYHSRPCSRPAVVRWWPHGLGPLLICVLCYRQAYVEGWDPSLESILGKEEPHA